MTRTENQKAFPIFPVLRTSNDAGSRKLAMNQNAGIEHTSGHLSPSILVIWEDLKGFHSPTYGNNLSRMSRRFASRCKRRICFRQSSEPSLAHHFCSRAAFCEIWYDLRVRYISPTVKLTLSVDSSRNWVSASVEISKRKISF